MAIPGPYRADRYAAHAPRTEPHPRGFGSRLLEHYGDGERLLLPEEVAVILQISTDTLSRWRRTGEGPVFVKLGRGRTAPIRYRLADVIEFVEQSLRRSTSDAGPR